MYVKKEGRKEGRRSMGGKDFLGVEEANNM